MLVVLAGKESTFGEDLRSHATLSYLITVSLSFSKPDHSRCQLGRRCSIYEERSFSPDYNTHNLDGDWRHWVKQESIRR